MARLQILELPEVFVGAASETPFVLVIDQWEPPPYPGEDGPHPYEGIAEKIGARAVLVFEETVEIPANDTTAYLESVAGCGATGPNFASPIAGRVEVRQPCPYCGDRQMIPRSQFTEHMARVHPEEDSPGA
ncbi:hypothetical protein [Streptomyces sp. KN37]|uniref:hypothetical protein n=1 Tax=Streptomyces sp. KN37 TaxID=3090667 RepID=UPI002A762598|nr:hypothetical protein [Streptomyces sp. KN37]WPO70213.1 hypothetical protein R9806_06010 [Streptomyces sp. KN37]